MLSCIVFNPTDWYILCTVDNYMDADQRGLDHTRHNNYEFVIVEHEGEKPTFDELCSAVLPELHESIDRTSALEHALEEESDWQDMYYGEQQRADSLKEDVKNLEGEITDLEKQVAILQEQVECTKWAYTVYLLQDGHLIRLGIYHNDPCLPNTISVHHRVDEEPEIIHYD